MRGIGTGRGRGEDVWMYCTKEDKGRVRGKMKSERASERE